MKHLQSLYISTFISIALAFSIEMACSGIASAAESGAPISATDRTNVLHALEGKLKANYVFPEVAERVAKAFEEKTSQNSYAKAETTTAFAALLSEDLRAISEDKHFRVFYDPDFHVDENLDAKPSPEDMDKKKVEVAHLAYGIEKIERLPGNVGYLELRGFGPTEFVGAAYTSALSLLSGTDALILDLRRNGGGEPSSVAYLMSHFFAQGDERHLNDIYTRRQNATQQYWTDSSVTLRYTKPVYVLISPRTFSGGEECAYDFQTQQRATLVGETTGGGGNAVDRFSLGSGLIVNIPTGRAINPITHSNWEHIGVKPDIAVAPALAQQTAYVAILRTLIPKATDPEERESLQRILALAEKGEGPKPSYTLGH